MQPLLLLLLGLEGLLGDAGAEVQPGFMSDWTGGLENWGGGERHRWLCSFSLSLSSGPEIFCFCTSALFSFLWLSWAMFTLDQPLVFLAISIAFPTG